MPLQSDAEILSVCKSWAAFVLPVEFPNYEHSARNAELIRKYLKDHFQGFYTTGNLTSACGAVWSQLDVKKSLGKPGEQTQEEKEAIVGEWESQIPLTLIKCAHNIGLISKFVNQRLKGYFSVAGLNAAINSSELKPLLHWLPPSTVAAPAQQASQKPAKKLRDFFNALADVGIQAETGRASRSDIEADEKRKAAERANEIDKKTQNQRYLQWRDELSKVQTLCEYRNGRISHALTDDARKKARIELDRRFPEYRERDK